MNKDTPASLQGESSHLVHSDIRAPVNAGRFAIALPNRRPMSSTLVHAEPEELERRVSRRRTGETGGMHNHMIPRVRGDAACRRTGPGAWNVGEKASPMSVFHKPLFGSFEPGSLANSLVDRFARTPRSLFVRAPRTFQVQGRR